MIAAVIIVVFGVARAMRAVDLDDGRGIVIGFAIVVLGLLLASRLILGPMPCRFNPTC